MPKLLGVVPLESDPKTLGKFKWPHYRVSRDGLYLRGQNVLGDYWIKQKYFPEHLASMGDWKGGHFTFTAPRIPKEIVGQILDFFRRVYEKDKTEAEVLLLFQPETKTYKVFVPWQICTGASVHSLYDPAEIENDWIVIGSMHSHCNFSAFHSGTDTADASVFNGLHVTIGHVNSDKPSWAVMVMVNEQEFEFKSDTAVLEIEDIEALNEFTAPDEWFAFIKEHVHEVVVQEFKSLGKEQLDAFERSVHYISSKVDKKPTSVSALPSRGWGDDNDDYAWWNNSKDRSQKDKDNAIDNWRTGGYNWLSGPGYQSTRFNEQLRKSLPSQMLDQKSNILPEYIREVLAKEVDKLYDLAAEYGLILDWEFYDIQHTSDEPKNENTHLEGKLPDGTIVVIQGGNEVPISVLDEKGNVVSRSTVALEPYVEDIDRKLDDLEDIRENIDDLDDYSGEDGFFRAIRKIYDESDTADEIDRKMALLINMEDA